MFTFGTDILAWLLRGGSPAGGTMFGVACLRWSWLAGPGLWVPKTASPYATWAYSRADTLARAGLPEAAPAGPLPRPIDAERGYESALSRA
jgi:hypothetical protein